MAEQNVFTELESDELIEMYCEQCEKYGIQKTANGFCNECLEYLCDTCNVYHKRYIPDHNIQDSQSMPSDFCFEKCEVHSRKILKFYCPEHDKFACMLCKESDHPDCKLRHIPSYVRENITEINTLTMDNIAKIDEASKETESKNAMINKHVSAADLLFSEASSKIKRGKTDIMKDFQIQKENAIYTFDKTVEVELERLKKERKELIQKLDDKQKTLDNILCNRETEAFQRIEHINKTDKANIDFLLSEVSDIKTNLETLKHDLEQKAKIGQKCKSLIATKIAQQEVKKLCTKLQFLDVEKGLTEYEADYSVADLNTLNPKSNLIFVHKTENPSLRQCQHLDSIKLNRKLEWKQPKFMSLCLLSDRQLLIADNNNNLLQCFGSIQNPKCNSVNYKLPCQPWDMTKLTDEEVAITFPNSGSIRIPTFTKSMDIKKATRFKTRLHCHGIAYSRVINKLAVTFTDPPEIQIIDQAGTVFKSISRNMDGDTYFVSPLFAAASLCGGEIYISDTDKNTIFSISVDGFNLKNVYTDADLELPLGLTVDETGAVFVCGKNSNNIHVLSSELSKVQVLLGGQDGIKRPVSVAYRRTEKTLYVSMYRAGNIEVFQLENIAYI